MLYSSLQRMTTGCCQSTCRQRPGQLTSHYCSLQLMTGWMSSSHLQTEDWTTDISFLQSAADDWLDVVQPPADRGLDN